MSKREMIESYVSGELDRRGFIRGLTALGVSAGAAATYALNFGPSTAASSASNGFIVRAGQQDVTYGTAITLKNDLEGLSIALSELTDFASLLDAGLAEYSDGEFDDAGFADNAFEILSKIRLQVTDQLDAIVALEGDPVAGPIGIDTSKLAATPQAFLNQLSDQLKEQASTFAAIAPAHQDGEARQTVTNIGFTSARHAAIVNYLAGRDPLPSSFEEPKLP